MNFSFLKSLFFPTKKELKLPDSLLVKALKNIATENELYFFQNETLFHHNQKIFLPLFIADSYRGIFLFEYKDWAYDDLKNATVQKTSYAQTSEDSLAYEKTHDFIKQKFNELTHTDGVPIYNFVLMQNLNKDQYRHLHDSFQSLLPQERVMFNDSTPQEILIKLKSVAQANPLLPKAQSMLCNLFVQYAVIHENEFLLATQEQRSFITAPLQKFQTLYGTSGSGKTNTLLLKALYYKLLHPDAYVIIIEPTRVACDILKQRILSLVEHAIVMLDLNTIQIITPIELVNKHLAKLSKPQLKETLFIDDTLMQKKFASAELLLCDDTDLLEDDFLSYLKHIQANKALIFVTNIYRENYDFRFNRSFHESREIFFKEAPTLAKTMRLLDTLLQNYDANDILVISNTLSKEKLNHDLKYFIRDKALLLDSSKNLLDQPIDSLLLVTYAQISSMHRDFVIMIDICEATNEQIHYASHLAKKELYIIYEEECEAIRRQKAIYETKTE